MSGSKPGERRGGRKKGVPNKANAELKEIARLHAPAMLAELVRLATSAQSEAARVAAATQVLDRGHGKPPQALTGDGGGPIQIVTQAQRDAAVRASYRADR